MGKDTESKGQSKAPHQEALSDAPPAVEPLPPRRLQRRLRTAAKITARWIWRYVVLRVLDELGQLL